MKFPKVRKLSRRSLIRLVSYGIALVVALGGFTAHGYFLAVRYRTQLEYTYQRALNDLSNYLSNINMGLKKGLYAGTPMQLGVIAAELWRDSGSAKSCVAQMPINDAELQKVAKFLSQVGEYSMSLARKMSSGSSLNDEDRKTLSKLAENASKLAGEVNHIESELSEGRLWLGEVRRIVEKSKTQKDVQTALSKGAAAAEEAVVDTPSLIYDGPYSDGLLSKESEMLKNAKPVSAGEARNKAAEMTGRKPEELKEEGSEESKTPAYIFGVGDVRVAVTKQGGFPLYFYDSREVNTVKIGYDEAVVKAKDYLKNLGFETVKESYYMTNENVCVINFAYLMGDVICYADLIKVGVALDNGKIVSLDARGYIMNHTERSLPAAKVTESEARASVNSSLQIKHVAKAVIPKDSGAEKYCYEFACKTDNDEDIYVYVNVETGQEEDILILLKVDGGVLTY